MTVALIDNDSLLDLGTCVIAGDDGGTIEWLCPQLKRFLGGELTASSEGPGCGATFTLVVPLDGED